MRFLHEDDLAREEVPEVDQLRIAGDGLIRGLFKGKPNIDAEGGIAARTALCRAHDSVARAGDHHPPGTYESLGKLEGIAPIGMLRIRTRAPEDRDLTILRVWAEYAKCVPQFLKRAVHELQLGTRSAIAEKMDTRRQQLPDELDIFGRR